MGGLALHELTDELKAVMDGGLVFDEATGEILFDESSMDALQVSVAVKARAVMLYSQNLHSLAKARKEAYEKMKRSSESAEARAVQLDNYLLSCIEKVGGRIETPEATISVRKNPPSVQVIDESKVPPEYMKETVKVTRTVDKTAVKDAIKGGEAVPGCALVHSKRVSIQ